MDPRRTLATSALLAAAALVGAVPTLAQTPGEEPSYPTGVGTPFCTRVVILDSTAPAPFSLDQAQDLIVAGDATLELVGNDVCGLQAGLVPDGTDDGTDDEAADDDTDSTETAYVPRGTVGLI